MKKKIDNFEIFNEIHFPLLHYTMCVIHFLMIINIIILNMFCSLHEYDVYDTYINYNNC